MTRATRRRRSVSVALKKTSKQATSRLSPISFSLISYMGLEDCECDIDGRFKGLAFPPAQSALIWRLSWLSLFSGLYALSRGHVDVSFVPLGVWVTSLLFWSKPDLSWRRTLDIVYVQLSLWYQIWRARGSQYAIEFYFFTSIGMLCFLFSLTQKKSAWTSALLHGLVHILGNIGNVILYSGKI
jgi:hypothetical protein